MNWDQPLDIVKNNDGTYTRWGNTTRSKPRWSLGTPRTILTGALTLALILWLQFDWIVISPPFTVAGAITLVGITFFQAYLARLAWEEF